MQSPWGTQGLGKAKRGAGGQRRRCLWHEGMDDVSCWRETKDLNQEIVQHRP